MVVLEEIHDDPSISFFVKARRTPKKREGKIFKAEKGRGV
jgi:hypothetical protein